MAKRKKGRNAKKAQQTRQRHSARDGRGEHGGDEQFPVSWEKKMAKVIEDTLDSLFLMKSVSGLAVIGDNDILAYGMDSGSCTPPPPLERAFYSPPSSPPRVLDKLPLEKMSVQEEE